MAADLTDFSISSPYMGVLGSLKVDVKRKEALFLVVDGDEVLYRYIISDKMFVYVADPSSAETFLLMMVPALSMLERLKEENDERTSK